MATFRSGFKIFGELSLRQNIGRIRSVSEDRKPGSWSPEDQWAVRPPGSTCPEPCAPKKPAKPAKSWLSICKDPQEPLPCDIRHNNCPPPKETEKPWYSFITKKKSPAKLPPQSACRVELEKELEESGEPHCKEMEESFENREETREPEAPPPPCNERLPAPVIRLSCPPPKDLDLMLWCGKPGLNVTKIAAQCQSDKMPYDEFRPKKSWKPPPFTLPSKCEVTQQPFSCNVGRAPLSEFKQVDIPKPLYTRYKSVELEDENFLLCMTDARCPEDGEGSRKLALQPPPAPKEPPPAPKEPKNDAYDRPFLVAASQKPVRLKCAPKFNFQAKPTKLVERRTFWNPCGQLKSSNSWDKKPPEPTKPAPRKPPVTECASAPKVITGTLTDEPQTYRRNVMCRKAPHWMYMLSKPGSKDTPLVPHLDTYPKEPDWCGETDGLKFYDGKDEGLCPKPNQDPYKRPANRPCPSDVCATLSKSRPQTKEKPPEKKEKSILMPEKYNIRNCRPPEDNKTAKLNDATFDEFIDAKTSNIRTCSKLYPQMKENILYDLVRNCPLPPFDPTNADPPPRRPPEPECPQPMRYYNRKYSTFSAHHLRKPQYAKVLNRLNSDDAESKCKPRKLVPKPRECKEIVGPSCNQMEMPCCPKARVPPKCDIRRPMPPCKKKLPPKPSYSECSRDPPPCPRMTECNAWDKKDPGKQSKKGRRGFSNWAREQEELAAEKEVSKQGSSFQNPNSAGDNPTAPGPSYSEYLDLKNRGQSLNKNKWSSHTQRKVFSGKELMLNFVNPTEDANSYYKCDTLVRRRKPQWRKLNSAQPKAEKNDDSVGSQELHERKVISALLQDNHTRNEVVRIKKLRANETTQSEYNTAEENSSKAIVSSIGSWFNGFVKAQKRSKSCPPAIRKIGHQPTMTYVETVDVDRIMKLTKPYRSRTKSQSYDSLTYFPSSTTTDYRDAKVPSPFKRFWGRNRNRALMVFPQIKKQRAQSSMWKYECISPNIDPRQKDKFDQGKPTATVVQSKSKGSHSKKDILPRLDGPKVKGPFHTVEGLGGRAFLLNAENPTTRQFSNTSLYRTYMAVADGKKSKSSKLKKVTSRHISGKAIASMSKSLGSIFVFPKKSEKNSSSHAVQSLPKKAKPKVELEKSKSVKSKFMQSATSCFVANAIAKKEQEGNRSVRRSTDGKLISTTGERALVALGITQKPWVYVDRYNEPSIKKSIRHATVMKNRPKKWLQEIDEFSSDYLYKGRRPGDSITKDEVKYTADKNIKRREVKNMLSKLDVRNAVLKAAESTVKIRQKNQAKKDSTNSGGDEKALSGRFSWQHALFRSNVREIQKSVVEVADDPPEQAFVNDVRPFVEVELAKETPADKIVSESSVVKKLTNNVELYDSNLDVVEYINVEEDKPSTLSVDKLRERLKDQIDKLKWMKLQRSLAKGREKASGSYMYEKVCPLKLDQTEVVPLTTTISKSDITRWKSQNSLSTPKFTRLIETVDDLPKDVSSSGGNSRTVEERQAKMKDERIPMAVREEIEKDEAAENDKSWRKRYNKPGPTCPECSI
ncbi:UNVERIFIED_CONTAM: hypothetical protein PYX00_000915 [Menopon gallinae]|uniref:Uncharacterized protein n=1 Tax=Menopon gallinae TaxID=328185 RepID=A0AAW2IC40_9NEOP